MLNDLAGGLAFVPCRAFDPVRLLASVALVASIACVRIEGVYQQSIDVTRGATFEERVATAHAVVTVERLARLKKSLLAQMDDINERDLDSLNIRYDTNERDGRVRVVLGVRDLPSPQAARLLEAGVRIVSNELQE